MFVSKEYDIADAKLVKPINILTTQANLTKKSMTNKQGKILHPNKIFMHQDSASILLKLSDLNHPTLKQ